MAIAYVSGATANDTTTSAVTGSLGTTATGQLIVLTISDDSALNSVVTTVTDNKGNTYARVDITATGDVLTNSSSTQMWYAVTTAAGASHTVTVTWSDAAASRLTAAAQYFNGFTGTPTIDKIISATGSSTSASPGTSGVTVANDELVVIGAGHDGATSAFSLGTGYTNLTTVTVTNATVGQESKVVSATGTQTGTMTIAATRAWGAILATFRDVSASTRTLTGVSSITGLSTITL